MRKIRQWSYSTLKAYKQCPSKVKFSKLDKIREPGSPQMDRGSDIHQLAEDYIRDHQSKLPVELKLYKKEFAKLWKLGTEVRCEEEWAFDTQWRRVEWDSPHAWVRMKIDAFYIHGNTLYLIDYKTGKVYENNRAQLSFYAMAAMKWNPTIDKVIGELWYLDQGPLKTAREVFNRDELPAMHAAWEHEVRPLLSDTIFAPRPGFYCSWCFYAKDKNGNCEYSSNRETA